MKKIFALFTLLIMTSEVSLAAGAISCVQVFAAQAVKKPILLPSADIDEQLQSGYEAPNIHAYRSLKRLILRNHALASWDEFISASRELIKDESLSTFHELLQKVIDKTLDTEFSGLNILQQQRQFEKILFAELVEFMPEGMAKERSEIVFNQGSFNKKKLMQALGNMTAKESLEALIGPNGIHQISTDSLVGRYIREARELGVSLPSFVGKFQKGPGYEGRGGEKLYLAVNDRTLRLANQIFGKNPHLLKHDHAPHQGTLQMHHRGSAITYAKYDYEGAFAENGNSIIPVVVASSKEASNLTNYFTLGKIENKYAKYPWGFRNREPGKEDELFCLTGGYNSCTHWVGEIGFGEKFVSDYTLPGYNGDDPHNNRWQQDNNFFDVSALRTTKVGKYNGFYSISNQTFEPVGFQERKDRLSRLVWTGNMGREQLWSVVGDANAEGLSKGEWANPGWVLYSFLTRTTQDRVPLVFIKTNEQVIDYNLLDRLTREIRPE